MNFKVFARSLFLVLLTITVAFTVYANVIKPGEPSRVVNDTTQGDTNGEKGNRGDDDNIKREDTPITAMPEDDIPEPPYVKENTSILISVLGDVALGQDWRYNVVDGFDYVFDKREGDYSYFFSEVVHLLNQDDLTIANLETTLSKETEQAEKYDYGNNYWFKGRPEFAHILKAGSVEVANLANNHTYDFGPKGYEDTKQALDDAGVEHFGYNDVLYKEVKGIKIGIVGFNQLGEYEQGLDMDVFKAEVEEMTKKVKAESDLVIANFHWGKEYKYHHEKLQTELAYLAIDSGADMVIGHHPHVLQPIEQYKGRYIAYSLGNFCYGGVKKPDDYDTAIFQQTFVFDSDNVLQIVKDPNIIPCSVSSANGFNNYKPMVASGEQRTRVFEKMNYTPTLSEEEKAAAAGKTDMVRLDAAVKDIAIEMRYAGSNNITGKPVYDSDVAYLRKGTADKLARANEILLKQGYRIKVWDAYRSKAYQQFLYDNAPVKAVFLNPAKGYSVHTRGAAVDCTLLTLDGKEVDMPSDFDEGTALAYRDYSKCTQEQKRNSLILENTMKSVGFLPLKSEWWHFEDAEYKSYKPLDAYP